MNRRKFLLRAGHGFGALSLASGLSRLRIAKADPGYKALVCVFLYGGNDGNHLFIPLDAEGYGQYAQVRTPTSGLNIPNPSSNASSNPSWLPMQGSDLSGRPFGMHPSLVGTKTLFDSSRLAWVANVGTLSQPLTRADYLRGAKAPESLFSHLDQQNEWQSALSSPQARPTGWGGRLADSTLTLNAGSRLPMLIDLSGVSLFSRGLVTQGISGPTTLQGFGSSQSAQARYATYQSLQALKDGGSLVGKLNQLTFQGEDAAQLLGQATASPVTLQTVFPSGSLGTQLKTVASLIAARATLGINRQIFFCSLGGFDTHTAQLGTQASLLTTLDQALKAFYDATVELGVDAQVTSFTHSDFGRTFQPTAGAGSDHGWGSHHLVMGGAVLGGHIYGRYPSLVLGGADDADNEGRWIPSTSVSEFVAPLARWFGAANLNEVLPQLANFNSSRTDLAFL